MSSKLMNSFLQLLQTVLGVWLRWLKGDLAWGKGRHGEANRGSGGYSLLPLSSAHQEISDLALALSTVSLLWSPLYLYTHTLNYILCILHVINIQYSIYVIVTLQTCIYNTSNVKYNMTYRWSINIYTHIKIFLLKVFCYKNKFEHLRPWVLNP